LEKQFLHSNKWFFLCEDFPAKNLVVISALNPSKSRLIIEKEDLEKFNVPDYIKQRLLKQGVPPQQPTD